MDENLEIRLQRAASWIKLAEDLERAIDKRNEVLGPTLLPRWAREHELFVFYWIAFNALYGAEGEKEGLKLEGFFRKVEAMAECEEAEGVSTFKEAIQYCLNDGTTVIRDKFLDEDYWRNLKPEREVVEECLARCEKAKKAVARGSCHFFLSAVFDHLRVLRNQIMHGSASHGSNSKGYKDSVLPGLQTLRILVPAFFYLTKQHGDSSELKWDKVPFPRYGSKGHPRKSMVRINKKAG